MNNVHCALLPLEFTIITTAVQYNETMSCFSSSAFVSHLLLWFSFMTLSHTSFPCLYACEKCMWISWMLKKSGENDYQNFDGVFLFCGSWIHFPYEFIYFYCFRRVAFLCAHTLFIFKAYTYSMSFALLKETKKKPVIIYTDSRAFLLLWLLHFTATRMKIADFIYLPNYSGKTKMFTIYAAIVWPNWEIASDINGLNTHFP